MAVQQHAFPEIEGPDFVKSEEVAEVGRVVLDLHGGIGGVGRIHPIAEAVRDGELSILWLLNQKPFNPETDDEDEPEVAGKCVKAPGLWRDVTGYHFAIWAREYFWNQYDDAGRRALVLHELLHVEVNRDKDGNPKFAVRKHDVEDFVDVARQYGPAALAGEGGRYVRAAALFAGEPEPIAAARSGSMTVSAGERSVTLDAAAAERIQKNIDRIHANEGKPASPKARKDQALAEATAQRLRRGGAAQAAARPAVTPDDRIGTLVCQGSNHVPGHTPGCPKYVVS
jgi:hypothetical protein